MKRRASSTLGISTLAIALLLGGAAFPVNAKESVPITIALEAPLSGNQSANGEDMLRGAQLAATQINAAGGVLGRDIRIIAIDDAADPNKAASAVKQAKRASAVAVVGPYNSGVGVKNLPTYVANKIFPMRMTSAVTTEGYGATTQPMESQIAPVEITAIVASGVTSVAMLIDPSDYTATIAEQTKAGLLAQGITVTEVSITEAQSTYLPQITEALATGPGMLYSSTYYPEGSTIAKELATINTTAKCFMGLANVDPAFVQEAGLAAAQNCTFSGVPAAPQLPTAKKYTNAYVKAFQKRPGVWGAFTYDSVNVLAAAMQESGSTKYAPVKKAVFATKNFTGATGSIAFQRGTGNRINVPVEILRVNDRGVFVIAR
jgi:branched-chain amino acid transport system substrate-binding protein